MSNLTHPGDPVGPALYQADVTAAPIRYEAGQLRLPRGPGLGILPDPDKVVALTAPLAWGASQPIDSLDRTVTGQESQDTR